MKLINRNECVLTGQADLEPLYTLKDFPVFMGCTDQDPSLDIKADMSWSVSRETGIIQLNPLLPLEVLYPESHGAGCVGALWASHHQAFAQFVSKFTPSSVLEIGGSHGILAKEFEHFGDIPWSIIEPNPSPIENSKAKFIVGFFDEKFTFEGSVDAVVHSHVFEHIYNPDLFMKHLSKFIPEGKYLIFSLPNMKVMLERMYTNCLNFEHTILLTEDYVEFLLAKYGFRIEAKEYFRDDHSIFFAAVRDSKITCPSLPDQLYQINKKLYLDYVDFHAELVNKINSQINSSNGPVYLFGAHVFSQYLISFGLNAEKIICLLDNDPHKAGKRLYGTNLVAESPKILKDLKSPVVILRAGVYTQEIKKDILENINSSTIFLE